MELQEMVSENVMEIIAIVFTLLGGVISYHLIAFLRRKNIWEIIKQKEVFAVMAVRFAEEFYSYLDGHEKLEIACDWAVDQLSKIGIKTTREDILGIIVALFRELKDDLGEEWANHSKEKTEELSSGNYLRLLHGDDFIEKSGL